MTQERRAADLKLKMPRTISVGQIIAILTTIFVVIGAAGGAVIKGTQWYDKVDSHLDLADSHHRDTLTAIMELSGKADTLKTDMIDLKGDINLIKAELRIRHAMNDSAHEAKE